MRWARATQSFQVFSLTDYAGVHLEGDIAEKIKDHLDEHGGERRLNVSEDDGLYKDRWKKHDTRGIQYTVSTTTTSISLVYHFDRRIWW